MRKEERLTVSSLGGGYTLRDICDTTTCNGDESAEVEYLCSNVCEQELNTGESDSSCDPCERCPIKKAFNRLAEYENTGLSPDEIVKLNNKNTNKHSVKVKVRKLK